MVNYRIMMNFNQMLSVSGVCEELGCYNHSDYVYLGERYGYRLHSKDGFNYITGGGGVVFSLPTLKQILKFCTCPSLSSPDDMILGACLNRLKINAIHSPRFHQVSFLVFFMNKLFIMNHFLWNCVIRPDHRIIHQKL